MEISLLAYVAIFSDSFWKSYVFTLFQSNCFQSITRVNLSVQRSSCLFWGAPFSEQTLFPSIFFFQNSYFFIAKLLSRSQTLRIGNSLVRLPFGIAIHKRYLQKSYFLEADSSAQHQLFQKSKVLEKATFQKSEIPHYLHFLENYIFNAFFINRYLL